MSDTFNTKQPSFKPGKKLPILGIYLQTRNRWIRWGLPIAAGLTGALIIWYLRL